MAAKRLIDYTVLYQGKGKAMNKGTFFKSFMELYAHKYINTKKAQKVLIIPLKKKINIASGILHKYANNTLLSKEEGALENAMVQKHM